MEHLGARNIFILLLTTAAPSPICDGSPTDANAALAGMKIAHHKTAPVSIPLLTAELQDELHRSDMLQLDAFAPLAATELSLGTPLAKSTRRDRLPVRRIHTTDK